MPCPTARFLCISVDFPKNGRFRHGFLAEMRRFPEENEIFDRKLVCVLLRFVETELAFVPTLRIMGSLLGT